MALRCAVDTNVLLRLSNRNHPQYELIRNAMRLLTERGAEFCFTAQNIGEFWNVSTRPADKNGFALSVDETEAHARAIERTMTLLPETESVYQAWRQLLLSQAVRGVQVHDAHLAAVLGAHGVTQLLTFDTADFKRFSSLAAMHPNDVQSLA